MTPYLLVKHIHVACVAISGAGFLLRGLLMLRDSPLLGRRWLRTAPHINDSLLLAAAIALAAITGQYPFVDAWLTAKVFGLLAYISLGAIALQAGRSRKVKVGAWLAALAVFGYIVSVALARNPLGFLAPIAGNG